MSVETAVNSQQKKPNVSQQITAALVSLAFLVASIGVNLFISQGANALNYLSETLSNNVTGTICIIIVCVVLFITFQQIVLRAVILRRFEK